MSNELESILKLSVSERILMVEAIWDSIAAEKPTIELSEEQKHLLEDRLTKYRASPGKGLDWNELKSELENEL